MCRSPNYQPHSHDHEDADPFTITAFYVRLRASRSESNENNESYSKPRSPMPDSLTLLLYPPLSICNKNNSNNIPPFSPATLSLRRVRLPNDPDGDVIVFGCKQRVRATTQVLRFQVYVGETKLLKGAIKKLEDNHHSNLECCKCELIPGPFSISEAELLVAMDGHVAASGKVTVKEHKLRSNKHRSNKSKLEDIPEETELRVDTDVNVDADDDVGADANPEREEAAIHLEMDLEVLRKAMDMGIWVLCLGLGFMVSKASITNFRPRPTFL